MNNRKGGGCWRLFCEPDRSSVRIRPTLVGECIHWHGILADVQFTYFTDPWRGICMFLDPIPHPEYLGATEQDREGLSLYADNGGDDTTHAMHISTLKTAQTGTVRRAGATGGSFDSRDTSGGSVGSVGSSICNSSNNTSLSLVGGLDSHLHNEVELGVGLMGAGSGAGSGCDGRLGGSLTSGGGGIVGGITSSGMGSISGIGGGGHGVGSANGSKVTTTRSRFINMFGGLFQWRVLIPPQSKRLVKQLSILLVVLWISWIFATLIQSTSRRLTNLAFILFTLAVSMTLILLIVIADVVGGPGVKVATLEYFNTWQLTIFMIANLMTGVVNMSMRTIYIAPTAAFLVLAAYALAITGVAWLLSRLRQH